ncbi:MAG: hypothetical protein JW991_02455 [Candidatus Pacebacteria bacterium]|nr:hypothetical protein [Candidatus Paceibacterota bacterium]
MKRTQPIKIKGQSLVELLLGLMVFGLVLTPFLTSLSTITTNQVKYRHQIQAVQHAREALEIAYNIVVNNNNWDGFVATHPSSQLFYPSSEGIPEFRPGMENIDDLFQRSINFKKEDNLLKTTARIAWLERGKEQEIELVTYLMDLSSLGN